MRLVHGKSSSSLTERVHLQTISSQAADDRRTQTEVLQLSPRMDKMDYGTSVNVTGSMDNPKSTDGKHTDGNEGCDNNGYQAD